MVVVGGVVGACASLPPPSSFSTFHFHPPILPLPPPEFPLTPCLSPSRFSLFSSLASSLFSSPFSLTSRRFLDSPFADPTFAPFSSNVSSPRWGGGWIGKESEEKDEDMAGSLCHRPAKILSPRFSRPSTRLAALCLLLSSRDPRNR